MSELRPATCGLTASNEKEDTQHTAVPEGDDQWPIDSLHTSEELVQSELTSKPLDHR